MSTVDLKKAKQETLVIWTQASCANPLSEISKGLFKILREFERLEALEQTSTKVEEDWIQEVRNLCNNNQQMAAIKLHRSKTGMGLRESMYAVEKLKTTTVV